MRNFKKGAVLALASAAAIVGSFITSSPAMAASSPIEACGGGSYHVIDSHDLGRATVYLLYNGTSNCAITWKDSPNDTYVNVLLRAENGTPKSDPGHWSTYAGPVKVKAAGVCIGWGGQYAKNEWHTDKVDQHCG